MADIKTYLGRFIKAQREASDKFKNQGQLAEKIGVSRATLIKIEAGETSTFFERIHKIFSALNTNFSEFENYVSDQTVEKQAGRLIANKDDLSVILKNIEEL